MNNRERTLAILNYDSCDRIPVVHFGFWKETLEKWHEEGHISAEESEFGVIDEHPVQKQLCQRMGFDFGWNQQWLSLGLMPTFEREVVEEYPNGSQKVLNNEGVYVLQKEGAQGIPAEIDHLLKDRSSWEEHYLPKLEYSQERISKIENEAAIIIENSKEEDAPLGLHVGSYIGMVRNWLGVEGMSFLQVDDEELFKEMVETYANLSFQCVEKVLELTKGKVSFDYAHFWEDICFNNGPLVIPDMFEELVGPLYKKITTLLKEHDINIISLDCDGLIDRLIPVWLENGVNTMFPIEVGTWNASIAPWREKYGRELRGVGGMRKYVFALEREDVDKEVERLNELVKLGGFIPCPDHRIPPDAKWDNVVYYCERLRDR